MPSKRVLDVIDLLELGEQSTFNLSLSILMQMTSENSFANRECVYLERYPRLLPVLLKILDDINPLKNLLIHNLLMTLKNSGQVLPHENDEGDIIFAVNLLSVNKSMECWPAHALPCLDDEVFKNIARVVDSNQVLLSVLTVLRNVSISVS